MLELKKLSAGYPGRDVLRNVDLNFTPGRVTVLLVASARRPASSLGRSQFRASTGSSMS